jgi:hypothetical protein
MDEECKLKKQNYKNMGGNLKDAAVTQVTKEKVDKSDFIKIENLVHLWTL